ncbi:hypothetical protein IQ254_23895 [Nodosilinea sp. LEGE 07088]|uniref:hypothetical protein n=1 Tax=Nodosilinea sp. LEGE 07088 TaxID=2777968 RepID=UPI00187FDB33|nr:hypothetical protein [Nodosilinea sp. LEGE 07088]MBE9140204.1 hypothetical protein [Nodosilinea sp. LEGE 07088]
MGTDICLYAEIKRKDSWHLLLESEENSRYYPEGKLNTQLLKPVELYASRNCDLFSILADVSNPNGHTLDNQKFEVISPPRGLPEDLSPELRDLLKEWEFGDGKDSGVSGPSWLLLSEVLRFDWHGKVMRYEAMVDARAAHLFNENEPFPFRQWPKDIPTSYSVVMRDGVIVRWTATYADAVETDFFEMLENLKQYGDPSQIRLVFWFDH